VAPALVRQEADQGGEALLRPGDGAKLRYSRADALLSGKESRGPPFQRHPRAQQAADVAILQA
jgi:hypothetical protein